MVSDAEFKRVYWASRRGMLELDLILVPFFEGRYASLPPARQALYRRLMECEDTELFVWLLGRAEPEDPALASLTREILEFSRDVDRGTGAGA